MSRRDIAALNDDGQASAAGGVEKLVAAYESHDALAGCGRTEPD